MGLQGMATAADPWLAAPDFGEGQDINRCINDIVAFEDGLLDLQIAMAKYAEATDRRALQIEGTEQTIQDLRKSLALMVKNPEQEIELFRRRKKPQ